MRPGTTILVIDDEKDLCHVVLKLLKQWGHQAVCEHTAAAGRRALDSVEPEVVLLDVGLPDRSGLDLLTDIREARPGTAVIMMTADGTSKTAVTAMKRGAEDYLDKPIDFEELRLILDKVTENVAIRREVAELRAKQRDQYSRDYVFLTHPGMRDVYNQIEMVADTDQVTVLIQGETGTGKEHVARLVHQYSPRAAAPFVELHCAALPETLLESELFGYEAGAFTDAKKSKAGLFEQAQGGTLFLDEIGELPLSMQTKLLKVLEDRKVRRLGGLKTLDLNLRLVAATNRDLQLEVKEGRFRADLYYRLNVFSVELPPLRDRPEDVAILARFFAERFVAKLGRRLDPLNDEMIKKLESYTWPGNIRELKNAMERLVIRADGAKVRETDLPPEVTEEHSTKPEDKEKLRLKNLMQKHRWNKSQAALEMGVSRPTFLKMLKKAGLQ